MIKNIFINLPVQQAFNCCFGVEVNYFLASLMGIAKRFLTALQYPFNAYNISSFVFRGFHPEFYNLYTDQL